MNANQEARDPRAADQYDVVVIGGALSGAATAILLLRQNPGMRLLIVEKSAQLTRRVGEATVEVSAFFMGRVLGLTQYLNKHHLVKQGLLGRTNRGRRCLIPGFTLKGSDLQGVIGALGTWLWLELTEGWRTWSARPASPAASAVPPTPAAVAPVSAAE